MNIKIGLLALILGMTSTVTYAASLDVNVEIPKLDVAEYHRPYVALWIENERAQHKIDLSVWYDIELKNNEGIKWLKDLRLWWRRSGRELDFPVDGLSGATKTTGMHNMVFTDKQYKFSDLPAGTYKLVVEASREVGGRELLRLPFTLPIKEQAQVSAQGKHELGTIQLKLIP